MVTFFIGFLAACGSAPAAVEQPAPQAEPVVFTAEPAPAPAPVPEEAPPPPPPVEEAAFDPDLVSQEVFDTTKSDIQKLIQDLNGIIRNRNYTVWVTYLSEPYFNQINSSGYLEEVAEDLYKRDQVVASRTGKDPKSVRKTKLESARDYFINVVIPSRRNDRVDDIEFVSKNQVIAYTVDDARGQRLILYNLENTSGEWKITN
jgi:hypothetical protein